MKKSQVNRKVILIKRRTRLDELIARFNTLPQAKFYVERMGADFSDYIREHDRYYQSLELIQKEFPTHCKLHVIDRSFLTNYIFAQSDIVCVLGQDGLVANTLKYLRGQPVIGVNPDPGRWEGVLLPFNPQDVSRVVPDVLEEGREWKSVTMGEVELSDGQKLLAVNDFFIGQKGHSSARYRIQHNGRGENHSSSGIIVSTGFGSTGWFKSVVRGASEVVKSIEEEFSRRVPERKAAPKKRAPQTESGDGSRPEQKSRKGGEETPLNQKIKKSGESESAEAEPLQVGPIPWSSDSLYYSVREPWPGRTTSATIVFGKIAPGDSFRITSYMPENGVIFSDGMESDYLEFASGMEAQIRLASVEGRIIT